VRETETFSVGQYIPSRFLFPNPNTGPNIVLIESRAVQVEGEQRLLINWLKKENDCGIGFSALKEWESARR